MRTLFIAGIERITIPEDLGRGDRFADRFSLTNNHDVVGGLMSDAFRTMAGGVEFMSLVRLELVVYAVEERDAFADRVDAELLITRSIAEVGMFLHRLWLIRDHAARMEFGYLEWPYGDPAQRGVRPEVMVSRNSIPLSASTAAGAHDVVEFSREELRRTRLEFPNNPSLLIDPQPATGAAPSRITRAWYFLQAARATGDLGMKVAHYCTCFETLFSTDNTELTHKLGERLALFLENTPEARWECFRSVKRAYGIRSKVVHGSGGNENLQALKETSVFCDGALRRVFSKLFASEELERVFESSNKVLDEYLTKLVFRQGTAANPGN